MTVQDSPIFDVSNARVLIVDDDPDVLDIEARLLRQHGYQVTTMSNCAAAKQALRSQSFHLVLTDLYLEPDGLGYELAEVASGCQPRVPAILVTGRPSFDSAQEAMRANFQEMVVKPIHEAELLAACRRAITENEILRRNAELQAQNRVLARILPRAIEAKDPTTRGHSERVVQYTDELARRCGLDESVRESLRTASLLHDIGKIGIPLAILAKAGPLTADEREVIKRHPALGFEILEPLVGSEDARQWVLQHHERWDGRGYPNGLAGEDVALPGRILILAEVYDALAEARSYKSAWEDQQIVDYFRAEAGHHFDPELAKLVADGIERMGKRFFARTSDLLF